LKRERELKPWPRAKKEALIATNYRRTIGVSPDSTIVDSA
jgi:predicted GIY-YIG superfamily endonuclease